MISLSQAQELAAYKKRTWRRATIEQRHRVAEEFERTGDMKKAYRAIKTLPADAMSHDDIASEMEENEAERKRLESQLESDDDRDNARFWEAIWK